LKTQIGRLIDYYILNNNPSIAKSGYQSSSKIATLESIKRSSILVAERQAKYIKNGQDNLEFNKLILNQIIDLIIKNNLDLIIFIPPFHPEFISSIDESIISANIRFCDSIANSLEQIEFINFLDDSMF